MPKTSTKKKEKTGRKGKTVTYPKLEPELRALIAAGRAKGFLTYEELNDALPDNSVAPDRIDQILMRLDERGIDNIDETEVEKRETKTRIKR